MDDERIAVDRTLWLRALVADDVPDIVEACHDPATIRFTRVPAPYGAADADMFVAATRPPDDGVRTIFAVAAPRVGVPDDAIGRLHGVVGLDVDEAEATAELGYWIAPWGRGDGRATRAARALCRHGFARLGLARIWMMASVDNPASNAIADRLGFTREGRARSAHRVRRVDGTVTGRVDMHTWSLLPGELRTSPRASTSPPPDPGPRP